MASYGPYGPKKTDLSFMSAPKPWEDEIGFRLAAKETIATGILEIASLKALLECPTVSGADKVEYAGMIGQWMEIVGDFYDGPWPNALSQKELLALHPSVGTGAGAPV